MVNSSRPKGTLVRQQKLTQKLQYEPVNMYVKHVQQSGKNKYQATGFNVVQDRLFRETLYGLHAYNAEQVKQMKKAKQNAVMFRTRKVQKLLHDWYNEVKYKEVNVFLNKLFPKSAIAKTMISIGFDRKVLQFEELAQIGLYPKVVAERLIKEKLLPENFFQLN